MKLLLVFLTGILATQIAIAAPSDTVKTDNKVKTVNDLKNNCPEFLNVEVRKLHSTQKINLCSLYVPGKPLLIVNTASHCGYTKQFKGLEALYQKYKDKNLTVIGFPSNSFKQEEDSEMGTANVCYQNYGVTFPMFEHVAVKGTDAHPLFVYLASQSQAPSWNFNKYLISGKDNSVQYFDSATLPENSKLEDAIKLSF